MVVLKILILIIEAWAVSCGIAPNCETGCQFVPPTGTCVSTCEITSTNCKNYPIRPHITNTHCMGEAEYACEAATTKISLGFTRCDQIISLFGGVCVKSGSTCATVPGKEGIVIPSCDTFDAETNFTIADCGSVSNGCVAGAGDDADRCVAVIDGPATIDGPPIIDGPPPPCATYDSMLSSGYACDFQSDGGCHSISGVCRATGGNVDYDDDVCGKIFPTPLTYAVDICEKLSNDRCNTEGGSMQCLTRPIAGTVEGTCPTLTGCVWNPNEESCFASVPDQCDGLDHATCSDASPHCTFIVDKDAKCVSKSHSVSLASIPAFLLILLIVFLL